MDRYNWGVDGKGSCHICTYDDPKVLFCGLPGVPGMLVVDAYVNGGCQ